MKKCPFCKAEIEDNAKFCLYCMSSLEKKEKINISNEKNKRWPILAAAVLVFVITLFIILLSLRSCFPEKDIGGTLSSQIASSEVFLPESSSFQSSAFSDSSQASSQNGGRGPDSSSDTSTSTNTSTSSFASASTSVSSHSASSSISIGKESSAVSSNKTASSVSQSASSRPAVSSKVEEQEPTISAAVYEYRKATKEECFPSWWIPAQQIDNICVITGVTFPSSSGIYEIPSELGGMKVAAIMPSAFCADNISKTVKKVVIPSTVRTIWEGAFSECYNLSDIYLVPEYIELFPKALPALEKRKATLTIHCSEYCKNFNFVTYSGHIDNFDAVYSPWNGGEL